MASVVLDQQREDHTQIGAYADWIQRLRACATDDRINL
jgi:hypothetical protein